MVRIKSRITGKKVLAVMALAALFEGGVMPPVGSFIRNGMGVRDRFEPETLAFVTYILREHRTGLGTKEEERLAKVILGEAQAHKIDPLFAMALIKTESTYYNWARSMKGAVGLMQILPPTGRMLARELGLRWEGEETLLNPYLNVKMGLYYFSMLRNRYNHDTKKTLSAYNYGPFTRSSYVPQGFANRVLANYRDLKERAEYLN